VTKVERGNLLAPQVLILFNKDGDRLKTPLEYELYQKREGDSLDSQFKIDQSLDPKAYRVDIKMYLKKKLAETG
ncbi:MAG: hypothetical protein ABIA63_10970, partial [bacterium]